MIYSIKINNFRAFKNVTIKMGKYITAIAGQNATGKSTLLGMLGNSVELKNKMGKPILHPRFRTEWSEIFKGSKSHDVTGSNLYEISFTSIGNEDNIEYKVPFRATWQENFTRFRLLPKRKLDNGKISAAKIPWPTLYLGLSRLFPVGEIEQRIELKKPPLTKEDELWLIEKYQELLSSHEKIEDFKTISTLIKKGVAFSTPTYDYLVNSSGEDNLGQILIAILSFKKLKQSYANYNGGLLLIDELDATLHPAVQLKLYKLLLSSAKDLNLQVVLTTHSMTLLEHICNEVEHNSSTKTNNIELVYLTTANIKLEAHQNPPMQQIKFDLLNLSSISLKAPKIVVFSEDAETRWFFKKLIPLEYQDKLDILDISLGCEQLLALRQQDLNYFSRVLFVLDGDVSPKKIGNFKNILILPGEGKSPEVVLYDYLMDSSQNEDHDIWKNPISRNNGFSIRHFRVCGPNQYQGKPRDQNKSWFNEQLNLFEQIGLYEYWKSENQSLVDDFIVRFKKAYNELAKINSIPKIQ